MRFEPIAIVGRSCILPDALTPETLWHNLLAGRSALRHAPPGRWPLPAALTDDSSQYVERAWSDVGGYVEGFEAELVRAGTPLPASFDGLDPVFRWVLHGSREALRQIGYAPGSARAGLILGNLSFPTPAMVQHAQAVWLDQQGPAFLGGRARELAGLVRPRAENRFMSGLPAIAAARELKLDAGAFALDAACASSLYAVKLACDWLHDRKADLMVAGAVNAADPTFIHVGFCALAALSRSGRSRPFCRDADGLVPSEGAAFVALKRLSDALAAGDRVLGVIRAIGLSNDGRGRGLLVPSEEGQIRAMQSAYAAAEWAPGDISFVECHATGTAVGDATELRSMQRVFEGSRPLAIGSIKGNLGHPVTASGLASILKILAGMEARMLPPMVPVEAPLEALASSRFRTIERAEPWPNGSPRRAAVNAFGFGGNNAHLLLEELSGDERAPWVQVPAERARQPIAIVGMCALAGEDREVGDFAAQLLSKEPAPSQRKSVELTLTGLRFPPKDLQAALPHQVLLLEAARRATAGIALPRDTSSVVIGMGADPETARYGTRWQLEAWAETWSRALGTAPSAAWTQEAKRAIEAPLATDGVLGTMANVFANRLNAQFDLAGPSLSVSAEELSGVAALEIAARALREHEIDAAVVGAVDMSDEIVHRSALASLAPSRAAADGAAVLVLKRLVDAERASERILGMLADAEPSVGLGTSEGHIDLLGARGAAHAASGLLQISAGVVAVERGLRPTRKRELRPWFGPRAVEVETASAFGPTARSVIVGHGRAKPIVLERAPQMQVFSGSDRESVLAALARGECSDTGPARLVIVAAAGEPIEQRRLDAKRFLERQGPAPEGVAFSPAPLDGELAFVFTGAAAAYPGMASQLLLALPGLAEPFCAGLENVPGALAALHRGFDEVEHPLDQLWACSLVCQAHARLTREILGLRAHASIGYSSGESNQLFAFGAWGDAGAMLAESMTSPIFLEQIAGSWRALESAWRKQGFHGQPEFRAYALAAPLPQVQAALAAESCVHLTIINSPDECVIGGEASACRRVLVRLGQPDALALPYRLAAHCPELEEIRDAYFALHQRETHAVPGVRFYWAGLGTHRPPSQLEAAEALTLLATRTLDFPRVIERAYEDGVRIFVEHGPRGLCSGWIDRILKGRPHLAVPLDVAGRSSLAQLYSAVARLVAAGIKLDFEALRRALDGAAQADPVAEAASLRLRAHRPPLRLPRLPGDVQRLDAAPSLAPMLTFSDEESDPMPNRNPPDHAARAEPAGRELGRATTLERDCTPAAESTSRNAAEWEEPIAPGSALSRTAPAATRFDRALGAIEPSQPLAAYVLAGHAAELRRAAAVHQDYLRLQAQVQHDFLSVQRNLLDALGRTHAAGARSHLVPSARAFAPATHRSGVDAAELRAAAAPNAGSARPQPSAADARTTPAQTSARAPASTAPLKTTDDSRQVEPGAAARPEGPTFSREQLLVHASGRISTLFGAQFAGQDDYLRQVRMPEPPLLLADRVTGIRGAPNSLGSGTIWTETDVRVDSWYLHQGRMPGGLMIEAGQADLMLASWLGVDRLNKSERIYRLLGCDLTYHAPLPAPGDVLAYDIHIDSHAEQGDIRLFFFHYDCRVRGEIVLSVRNGQAGFFSDAELSASAGILWDAANAEHASDGPLAPPAVACTKRGFSEADVRAFSEGKASDCFGAGFERARAHVSSPRIAGADMLLFQRVSEFDPGGGAWGRGYLRAERSISPDDWFFAGHFKNDPCMPGTLMFEGCLQVMSFYLAALGFTLDRDGYRFEPVPEQASTMRCRGQVTPSSKLLVYEVFVEEVSDGAQPTLQADLLCTVDGLKAFHARRVGLRLVPDWPLDDWQRGPASPPARGRGAGFELRALAGLRGYDEPKPVAAHAGFRFDYRSLLACAWGRPTCAFGPFYARFDSPRRVARLPGPPYHFISRVIATEGEMGEMKSGAAVVVEYDIPSAVWYFDDNGTQTMPLSVLMEAALQPCGWLASYVGSTLVGDIDLMFRNLDGTATLLREIRPGAQCITTRARLSNISRSAGMIIESFQVECSVDGQPLYEMKTVFGFFPKEAFENQSGLAVSDAERGRIDQPGNWMVDLRSRPARYFGRAPRLAGGMLCMLDRITAYDAQGGSKALGWVRAEKDVHTDEWFFKAHFFQDPVQPGSLGIEALCQLLQFVMIEQNLQEGIDDPQFEPIALERALTWKYRGQVIPQNVKITTELELTELVRDERGVCALADAYLWVDGKRIYHAKNLGMRIRSGRGVEPVPAPEPDSADEEWLDPKVDRWLGDHRPTWTLPALPMMSMIDRIALAAERHSGRPVCAITQAQVHRWLTFPDGPVRLCTRREDRDGALFFTLLAFRNARDSALSRFEPVASARVELEASTTPPPPWPALEQATLQENPYESAALFHGPAFQLLRSLRLGAAGASALIDLGAGQMPYGALGQAVLDAMTHAIPHDGLHTWSPQIAPDRVGYPYRIPWMRCYERVPAQGSARVEARFAGFDRGDPRFPVIDLQLIVAERVCIALQLVEIVLPKGQIGAAPPRVRRAFLRDRNFVPGVALSSSEGELTRLALGRLRESDWLPGNLATIYAVPQGAPLADHVAVKEHVARWAEVHPSRIEPAVDLTTARDRTRPLRRYEVHVAREADHVSVEGSRRASFDLSAVRAFWRQHFAIGPWPVEDLYFALLGAFVRDVVIPEPESLASLRGGSVLYLANHQVAVESLLFSVLIPAFTGAIATTLAKSEHQDSWLGRLIELSFSYPAVRDPGIIAFFSREDKSSLPSILQQLASDMQIGRSAMIHIEGTRALQCRAPVRKISSAVIDLALAVDCPVVPVRFSGALPVDRLEQRLEFPVAAAKQDIFIGAPISAQTLRALPLKERKEAVLNAINQLGSPIEHEEPNPPNPELQERMQAWRERTGASEEAASLLAALEVHTPESALILQWLEGARSGQLRLGRSQEDVWLARLTRYLFGPRAPVGRLN